MINTVQKMGTNNYYVHSQNVLLFPVSQLRIPPEGFNTTNNSLPDGRSLSEFNITSILSSLTDINDGFISSYNIEADKLKDITFVLGGYVIVLSELLNDEIFNMDNTSGKDLYASIIIPANNIESSYPVDTAKAIWTFDTYYSDTPLYQGLILTKEQPQQDDESETGWTNIDNPANHIIMLESSNIKTLQLIKDGMLCEASFNKFTSRSIKNIWGGLC